ncbi:MAG: DNA-3-methyladenine glycosylase 2 family protein [Acidimicrobiia bacterium]|nr:DNA-3-methyladenine glycosylase 2 family protein [Acidimicrobiia bacterium]
METLSFPVEGPLDLRGTLKPMSLGWSRWNQEGWWQAMRTPDGPSTVRIRRGDDLLLVDAWGPGASWSLDRASGLVGLDDDPAAFSSDHPVVGPLHRANRGLRFGRSQRVFEPLVYAVIGQKVTGMEAKAGIRGMTRRFGDPAPGPLSGLWLPPDPERLAQSSYTDFHDLGIERKRADTVRRLAREHPRLERLVAVMVPDAVRYLARFGGVGEWTVNETLVVSHGHTDAVSVGDYHLKHIVAWNLAGEERGTDERMLALLEPFRPHRARVVRLLERAGAPQRKGARLAVRGFEDF